MNSAIRHFPQNILGIVLSPVQNLIAFKGSEVRKRLSILIKVLLLLGIFIVSGHLLGFFLALFF